MSWSAGGLRPHGSLPSAETVGPFALSGDLTESPDRCRSVGAITDSTDRSRSDHYTLLACSDPIRCRQEKQG